MPSNLIIGNGLKKIEKIREFNPAYGMTEDEIIREFYDPPPPTPRNPAEFDPAYGLTENEIIREYYDPPRSIPSKNRPNLERSFKLQPVRKEMSVQLPNRKGSDVKLNTTTYKSPLARRREMMQKERQAQREADRKLLLKGSKL